MNFKISLSISTKETFLLIEISLNHQINLGRILILTILACPVHEHDTSLYLIGSFNVFHYHFVVWGHRSCIYLSDLFLRISYFLVHGMFYSNFQLFSDRIQKYNSCWYSGFESCSTYSLCLLILEVLL